MVKPMKIALVNPACLDPRISDKDAGIVPIGLFYIGAVLEHNGFSTEIVNLAQKGTDPLQAFRDFAARVMPDIIGFSVTNPNRWNAIECAIAAQQLPCDPVIVFGGPAATFMAQYFLTLCPAIDYIVTGEGEITFLELVKAVSQGRKQDIKNIKGLVFRQDKNNITETGRRRPADSLDSFAHPSDYFVYNHLAMSRGCPGKCTFCGSPEFWKDSRVRSHSPSWFADEIQALARKGVSHFYISDDTFTMDRQKTMQLCRLIIEKKLRITWNAISRVDCIDEDILFHMRRAGCIQLSFGVESGSEKIRKTLGKPVNQETIISAFRLTASYGILPRAYFIYGSPGETSETIQNSVELLKKIKPLAAIFYMLVIFPGTFLYRKALKQGLVSPEIWNDKIEDIPWFELDENLDFPMVKSFGDQLRTAFYSSVDEFAHSLTPVDINELYPFHADFLSRLAMTFSHGEYAKDSRIKNQDITAEHLYHKALSFWPDSRAFLGLAMLAQKKRQFDKAGQILEKGLKEHPSDRDLNICTGINFMNQGRFRAALDIFEPFRQFPETARYINICRQRI